MYSELYMIAKVHLDVPLLNEIVSILSAKVLETMAPNCPCLSLHRLSTPNITVDTLVPTIIIAAHHTRITAPHAGMCTAGQLTLIPHCALIQVSAT